ncbi:type II secretion system protein [Telmatospirillum siberiense]|uniref:Prepilin-type cleavage/methylation domain-containing protein n=1 Tax=Telmatospirillum siberiense TaxID=382514 RepID=A0A2N3Q1I4_9PROT|nr:type II secretion system protein [Telmatospirillum siberiense]PKU26522.1 hypothetical protein CWS72_01380 [Telmatospirillum siberiense]
MTRQDGFTLIEMAIVLALVGLLVGGGIFATGAVIERSRIIQTNNNLDQAEAALELFVVRNNRLPCPADGGLASGVANYGTEIPNPVTSGTACSVTMANSVLPWVTLGLDEATSVDGWGRRLSYVPAGAQTTPAWDSLVDPGLKGSGASATATLNSSNVVSAVTVVSAGSGYTTGASYTLSFVGGGGAWSTATITTAGTTMTGATATLSSTQAYSSPPNVVFHTAGCMTRTSGLTSTGRSPLCDGATQALAPSYPYGNYIAVYSATNTGTELTTGQPTAATSCNGATASSSVGATNVACAGGRAAYVLISHGPSGWYGWQKGGGRIPPPAGTTFTLKQYNSDASAGSPGSYGFVQGQSQGLLRNPTAGYFDDIVRWRTPAMMIQLCGAGACGNP